MAQTQKRIVLLPTPLSNFDNLKFVKLSHPAHLETTTFGISKENGLFQISKWENKLNSWAIGDTIVSDGNLFILTQFDILYLLLPMLEKSMKQGFCKLDDILYEETNAYPDLINIMDDLPNNIFKRLQLICDYQFQMDDHFFRLSEEKLLTWLKGKTDKIVANLDRFEACKEHITPSMTETDRLKLAIRVLSDVLTKSAKEQLMKALKIENLKGEALVYFNDEIKHRVVDPLEEKKTTKKAKPASKPLKSRNTSGMKKLTSFFAKKT